MKIKANNLKNVMVTNGYINEEPLKELLPYIDAMSIDLKSIEDSFYKKLCKATIEPVLRTIELAAQSTHVEVTTLVIEGENSSFQEIERLAKRIAKIDKAIPLHLSRYFSAHKMTLPPTKIETIIEAGNIAKEHLDYVYIGNVFGMDNNTLCPECHNQIIDRRGIAKTSGTENGRCPKCGYLLNMKV